MVRAAPRWLDGRMVEAPAGRCGGHAVFGSRGHQNTPRISGIFYPAGGWEDISEEPRGPLMDAMNLDFWRRQWEAFVNAPIACVGFLVVGATPLRRSSPASPGVRIKAPVEYHQPCAI